MNKSMILHFPPFMVDAFVTLEGWRLNRKRYTSLTEQYYNFYCDSDTWDIQRLIDFQNQRLREIIVYCTNHTPYYRELFNHLGLIPSDISSVDDLSKLPCLDKKLVKSEAERLISDEFDPEKLDKGYTGGSTGTPAKLYFSPETWPAQYGFFWARWRPDVKRGHRYACFQGQTLVPFDRARPPFWRTNYAANQRLYSVFHLTEANLSSYLDNLNRFCPEYIQGYPSAMYLLAEYMERNKLHFAFRMKAAFSMSETIQPIHKETIERAWNCPLWDQYGQGERVASITLRECGNYHYDMDFGIIEFNEVGQDNGLTVAEIIGTSLINKAWTLIRYKMGDLALIDPSKPCKCGRPGPIIKSIIGRTGDILTMPDGKKVINITTAVKDIPGLLEFQIVHEKPSSVIANIVRGEAFTKHSEHMIIKNISERLGPSVSLEIRYPEKIERTASGKYKAIVSKV